MARVKRGVTAHRRHKKVLNQAKGFYGSHSRLFKSANEAVLHALDYATEDRKNRKRDFRRLWIARINAGCRQHEVSYSQFMAGLRRAAIELDRKVLADMAVREPQAFAAIVEQARAAL